MGWCCPVKWSYCYLPEVIFSCNSMPWSAYSTLVCSNYNFSLHLYCIFILLWANIKLTRFHLQNNLGSRSWNGACHITKNLTISFFSLLIGWTTRKTSIITHFIIRSVQGDCHECKMKPKLCSCCINCRVSTWALGLKITENIAPSWLSFLTEKQTTTKYNQAVGFSSVLAVCAWLESGLFIADRLWSRNIL